MLKFIILKCAYITLKSSKIHDEIETFGYFEVETYCVFGEIPC